MWPRAMPARPCRRAAVAAADQAVLRQAALRAQLDRERQVVPPVQLARRASVDREAAGSR